MPRPTALLAPVVALVPILVACGSSEVSPQTIAGIEDDLLAIDQALGRWQAERQGLPPDIGPTLVEAGLLDRVREDPFASGERHGSVTTYGFEVLWDEEYGDVYVVYSLGPDGLRSYHVDTERHRVVMGAPDGGEADDEIQSNLLIE